MNKNPSRERIPALLGIVEPHAPLLTAPPDTQPLDKIMSIKNLLRSIEGSYLYFNRVDSDTDFSGADPYDGKQLPKDQPGNASVRFIKAPEFSAADYYDQSRTRTYACCFSLENSAFIWKNYGNGNGRGKVGILFNFGRLRAMINRTLQPGNAVIEYRGKRCRQVFSVNYGLIDYVEWEAYQGNAKRLPNPIEYTYLKDKKYSEEKAQGPKRGLADDNTAEAKLPLLQVGRSHPVCFVGVIHARSVPPSRSRPKLLYNS